MTYDANGNVASRTDFNGNRTNYTYDSTRNLETQRVEGLTSAGGTTAQTRTTTTQWHPLYRLPTEITEPGRGTTFIYDPNGNLLTKTIAAGTKTRTWTYTYNALGRVLTANGPRTDVADVTTYTYDVQGNLATITNALGHLTQITAYDPHGRPLRIEDPNGLATTLAYDPRGRLITRTVGTETTTYAYDGVGQLTRLTLADGSFLSYTYDVAHRLTDIQDSLGNTIHYTLDLMGNRTREDTTDPPGRSITTSMPRAGFQRSPRPRRSPPAPSWRMCAMHRLAAYKASPSATASLQTEAMTSMAGSRPTISAIPWSV